MDVEIDHSSFDKVGLPIFFCSEGTTTLKNANVNIHENEPMVDFSERGISIFGSSKNVGDLMNVKIEKNVLGKAGVSGSDGATFSAGISVSHFGEGTINALVQNNIVQGVNRGTPLTFFANTATGAVAQTLNLTMKNNTVDQLADPTGPAIRATIATLQPASICLNMSRNAFTNVAGTVKIVLSGGGSKDVPIKVVQTYPTLNVDDAELDDANGLTTPLAVILSGEYVYGQPACTLPSFP